MESQFLLAQTPRELKSACIKKILKKKGCEKKNGENEITHGRHRLGSEAQECNIQEFEGPMLRDSTQDQREVEGVRHVPESDPCFGRVGC